MNEQEKVPAQTGSGWTRLEVDAMLRKALPTVSEVTLNKASAVLVLHLRLRDIQNRPAAPAAPQWIATAERLPERAHAGAHRSVPVLACEGLEVFEGSYVFTEQAWYVSAGNWKNTKVTHWQPLPAHV